MNPDQEMDPMQATSTHDSTVESLKSQRGRPLFLRILLPLFRAWSSKLQVDEATAQRLKEQMLQPGTVLVISNTSILEYLLLLGYLDRHKLPGYIFANNLPKFFFLAFPKFFAHFLFRFRSLLTFSRPVSIEPAELESRIQGQERVLLFLNQSRSFTQTVTWSVDVWEKLMLLSEEKHMELFPLPIVFLWGRQPDRLGRTLFDLIFGDALTPGKFRKVLIALRYWRQVSLRAGLPIDMNRFNQKAGTSTPMVKAKKLRRLISSFIYREKKLLIGPPLRSRQRIVRALLKDPSLAKLVASVSRREKISKEEAWNRCEKSLNEMISDYSGKVIALTYHVYRWLVSKLYQGIEVDDEGLKKLKEIVRDHPIILIPSHKSHIDYVLMAGLFYENNLTPPHVAAGVNLNFWPMGSWFRKTGAFFIRRKIAGDLLYVRLLTLYIRWLIRHGYSQEFFIEGGRSRTGKLVFPKHGLLSMQVDAYLTGACKDLFIIPSAITYDRVVEERAYKRELLGRGKERETVWQMLRARQLLRHRHGKAYIRFSDPISVKQVFSQHEKVSARIRKQETQKLAESVVRDIAQETVVTGPALFSSALLTNQHRGITHSRLLARAKLLESFIETQNATFSDECMHLEKNGAQLVEFFEETRKIEVLRDSKDPLILIRDHKRISLDYYKNTTLHFLLPAAVFARTELCKNKEFSSEEYVNALLDIFRHEFFLSEHWSSKSIQTAGRDFFNSDQKSAHLQVFSRLISNYLDAYHLTTRHIEENQLTGRLSDTETNKCLEMGQKLLALGELDCPEALSSAYIQSAAEFMTEKKIEIESSSFNRWKSLLNHLRGS